MTQNNISYSEAMTRFHTLFNAIRFVYKEQSLLFIHDNAEREFLMWVANRGFILPWTVSRRLKQLRSIFYDLSGGVVHISD